MGKNPALQKLLFYHFPSVVFEDSCAPEFMSKGFSLLTPKDFITPVTHHAALPMQPSQRHFVIEMAMQLHLSIFSRQFGYSA